MPKPQRYMSRKDLGWKTSPAASANPRSGLCIHYDSADQKLAEKTHTECVKYWKNTRSFHTGPQRGWQDIGYSFLACAHGFILEGRGLFKQQAAQPGGNSTYYSCTLATGPTDVVTAEQIEAVRQLRAWLMEPESSIGSSVKGHRDFFATSCPGERAYAMVRNGTFAKKPQWNLDGSSTPAPEDDKDWLDMADEIWFSTGTTQKLEKDKLVCLLWHNGSDPKATEKDPFATVAFSGKRVVGDVFGEVIAKDDKGNLVEPVYEVVKGKVKGDKSAQTKPTTEFMGDIKEATRFSSSITEWTQKDERLRLYIRQLGEGTYEFRKGKVTTVQADR